MSSHQHVRLTIIIPCFNDGQFIREALASAEACLEPIYEIIVVNDGSTDPFTCQVLEDLKKSGYRVVDQSNQGLAAARNTGIKLALGEYILPLDSDNRIRAEYIRKGIEILDKSPDVAVVYSDVERFGEKIKDLKEIPTFNLTYDEVSFADGFRAVQKVPDFDLSLLINHNYIDACAVFRKSVWEECGPYDVNMPFGCYEDWDLWLSIAKKGYRFCHIPEVLFEYRVRRVSLSTAARSKERSKIVCKYIAAKHAALFPKEYRNYFKLYRAWLKILRILQPLRFLPTESQF